jgi:HlyD family secretion protein
MGGVLHQSGSNRPAAPARNAEPAAAGGRRWRVWLLAGVVFLAVAAVLGWGLSRRGHDVTLAEGPREAAAEQRDFVRTVRIHGTVGAVEARNITVPRLAGAPGGQMVITFIAPQGPVRRGERVVEFDRQNQIKAALDRRAEYLDLEEQIRKKQAEHSAATAADQTELVAAENSLQSAQLEMRKNEVLSRIDAEKNEQNLAEARARLEQLRQTLELRRSARRAELEILTIQRDRARRAMEHAERNAEEMVLNSPMDGMFVRGSEWRAGQFTEIQEGDQLWPGRQVGQVVNPGAMEIVARVNQADFPLLRVGQPVQVRFDAYPEMKFSGRVERLAAIGTTSSMNPRVRTFTALFSIEGSDPKLLPDLSASADVELERVADALVVPRDALRTEEGRTWVEVRTATGWSRRDVTVAALSDHEAAIASGIQPGATVRRGGG